MKVGRWLLEKTLIAIMISPFVILWLMALPINAIDRLFQKNDKRNQL